MNTKGIKFLAVLAVLAMAFAVFAVISDSQDNDATGASWGGTFPTTSNDDFEVTGTTYKVLRDLDYSGSADLPIPKSMTIDLNGKTIDMKSYGLTVSESYKFEIKDSTVTVEPSVSGTTVTYVSGKIISVKDVVTALGTSTVTLNSGTIESTGDSGFYSKGTGSTVIINGGYINAKNVGAFVSYDKNVVTINGGVLQTAANFVLGNNGSAGRGDNTLNVNGGIFLGGMSDEGVADGFIGCGIYWCNAGTLTVTGGDFRIPNGCGIAIRAGDVTVSGGKFTCGGTGTGKVGDSTVVFDCSPIAIDYKSNYPGLKVTDKITISGGEFESAATVENIQTVKSTESTPKLINLEISGGTFKGDIKFQGGKLTVPANGVLDVAADATLEIASGAVLENNGTINLAAKTSASTAGATLDDKNTTGSTGTNGIIGSGTINVGNDATMKVGFNSTSNQKLFTNKIVFAKGGILYINSNKIIDDASALFIMKTGTITVESVKSGSGSSTVYNAKVTFEGNVETAATGLADFFWTGDEVVIQSGTFELKSSMNLYTDVKFTVNSTLEITDGVTLDVKATSATTSTIVPEVGKNGILGTGTVVVKSGGILKLADDTHNSMLTAANTKIMTGGTLYGMIASESAAITPTSGAAETDYILAKHNVPTSTYWVKSDGMTYEVNGAWTVNVSDGLFANNNSVLISGGSVTVATPITITSGSSLNFGEAALPLSGTQEITNNGEINYAKASQVYANVAAASTGSIHIEGESGDEKVVPKTDTEITEDTFSDADVVIATGAVKDAAIPEGKTLVIQNVDGLTSETNVIDVSKKDSSASVVVPAGSSATFSVKLDSTTQVKVSGLKGTVTFSKGSIIANVDPWEAGTIELGDGDVLKLSGEIKTDDVTGVSVVLKTGATAAKVLIEKESTVAFTSGKLTVASGITIDVEGAVTITEGGAGTFNHASDLVAKSGSVIKTVAFDGAGKNIAMSGSDINYVGATTTAWTGKDANGGTWKYASNTLTLDGYNGTYNFKTFADAITSIVVKGDNKITYKVPDMAGQALFAQTSGTTITTTDTASLIIEVDYSKVSKDNIKDENNAVLKGAATFELNNVALTIKVTGSKSDWTTKDIKMTVITGAAEKVKLYSGSLIVDVFSSYAAKDVKVFETKDLEVKNSVLDIKTAGSAIKSSPSTAASPALFDNSVVLIIANDKAIEIAGDHDNITFDSCVSVSIKADDAIIGDAVTVKNSVLDIDGDVTATTLVMDNGAVIDVDGELDAGTLTITRDSALTVKDLAVATSATVTKGALNIESSAVFIGTLTNDDIINNKGTVGIYETFTNNGTLNNEGDFFVFAKEQNLSAGNNDSIAIDSDNASAATKVKVKSITLSEPSMNADGTVTFTAVIVFAKSDGTTITSNVDLKTGTDEFEAILTPSDLVDTTDLYYTLEITNGTASIKVTYKKLTEGADTKIGKSYSVDVGGKIIVKGTPDVEYDLEANAAGKSVTDTTVTYATKLIGASSASFVTGTSQVVNNTDAFVLYASANKNFSGTFNGDVASFITEKITVPKFIGDLTAVGDVDVNGTFAGDITTKGAVKIIDKKTMVGDITTEGAVTVEGTLTGDIATKDFVTISGTMDGDLEMTVGTTGKTLTVGGKFEGVLTFNSEYLAKSTDKPGEETIDVNKMTIGADMSTSEKTFVINLGASKNATSTAAGEGGVFSFGTLNAPVATKAVKITLDQGTLKASSDVTLPERFELVVEKDTTLEVAKNMKFNVKSAALKVSKDAIKNFITTPSTSASYGLVEYIMTFDIEGGAYSIYSDVAYALTNCDEGAELTLGSAAEINSSVSVKKGVNIIVDGVKLDFKSFGLAMGEGAKITLKGAGNLAFAVTEKDLTGDEYIYYTVSATIVYDDNTMTLNDVRFTGASTIAGKAATASAASQLSVKLDYNEGGAIIEAGNASGTIVLKNAAYKLLKDDTEDTLVFGTFGIKEGAVFDATSITDEFSVVDYKKDAGDEEAVISKIKLMPTIVAVNGTLNLAGTTNVKGVWAGVGTVKLAADKEFVLAASDAVPGAAAVDKKIPGSVSLTVIDTTDDGNGYKMIFAAAEPAQTLTLKATTYKLGTESVKVMTIAGDLGFGSVEATTDAFLNVLKVEEDAEIVGEDVYVIGAGESKALGAVAAKNLYVKSDLTTTFQVLDYQVKFESEGYTVYTYFANVDFDEVTDITIDGKTATTNYTLSALAGLVPGANVKLDFSDRDVNITIAEGKTLTIDVIMIIGTPATVLGDEGSSITGKVIIKNDANSYIIAYADVDLSEAEIIQGADNKTPAVYSILDIDDVPYAAIFANEGKVVLVTADKKIVPEIEGYTFTKWNNYDEDPDSFVGETNAYASAKAVVISVVFTSFAGVDYYLNGHIQNILDAPVEVAYGSIVTAKISDTSKYQGTPLVNGASYVEVGYDTLKITASGVSPIPEPPQPEPEPVVGDSGLSLTDILLIVLVILIAIMVVILVLRLNRS